MATGDDNIPPSSSADIDISSILQRYGFTDLPVTEGRPLVVELDTALINLVLWWTFAIHLPGVQQRDVDRIKENENDTRSQKIALFITWLRADDDASWRTVVKALQAAGENELADSIAEKYISECLSSECQEDVDQEDDEPLFPKFEEDHKLTKFSDVHSAENGVVLIVQTCNDNEYWAAVEALEPPKFKKDPQPTNPVQYTNYTVIGSLGGYNTAVIRTQQGNDCRQEVKNACKVFSNAKMIIGCGIAYAISRDKCKFGDVLISKLIENFVQTRREGDEVTNQGARLPVGPTVSKFFINNPNGAKWEFICSKDGRASKTHKGCILSDPTLVRSEEYKKSISKHATSAIGGEMEGWVLKEVADELSKDEKRVIEVIIIKGVADFGDQEKDDKWQFTAAKAAFDYIRHCIKNGPALHTEDQRNTSNPPLLKKNWLKCPCQSTLLSAVLLGIVAIVVYLIY